MKKQIDIFSLVRTTVNLVPDERLPEGIKLKKGILWCPYCSTPVKFKNDAKLGVHKCPICGISDRDLMLKRLIKYGNRMI